MRGLGADAPYWSALAEGRFQLQQCARCRRWHWPAVWRCADCGCWEQRWQGLELEGRLFSWTRSWHDFGAPREFGLPFVSVVVEIDGAAPCRVLGSLIETESVVRIGDRVTGSIESVGLGDERLPVLRWRLVSAA